MRKYQNGFDPQIGDITILREEPNPTRFIVIEIQPQGVLRFIYERDGRQTSGEARYNILVSRQT